MKNRIAFFDCARSLCMLYIVAYWHVYAHFNREISLPALLGGSLSRGVLATFFFISAYFLGSRNISSFKDALLFYKKRFIRFYPLYFLSCTSLLMIHILWNVDYISSFRQYVLSLFGLSCFFTPAPKTIWFVSMLIPFYLITPLINHFEKTWQKISSCIIIFLLMCALNLLGLPLDSRLALYFPVYSAGLILGSRIKIDEHLRPIQLICGLLLFFTGVWLYKHTELFIIHYLVMTGFVLFIIEAGKLLTKTVLSSRSFSFISYGSMAAYLFHRQFFGVLLVIMGKFPIWFFYLILLPLFLVICWFIQSIYDRIVHNFIRC